jgi:hypothetical protein
LVGPSPQIEHAALIVVGTSGVIEGRYDESGACQRERRTRVPVVRTAAAVGENDQGKASAISMTSRRIPHPAVERWLLQVRNRELLEAHLTTGRITQVDSCRICASEPEQQAMRHQDQQTPLGPR